MDFLNALPLPAALAILALVDGLSVGTLLIPVFFLIAPGRPRIRRILLYLGTITLFYLAVGVLFTLGLVNIVDVGRSFLDSTAGRVAMLVVGAAMLVTAICMPTPKAKRKRAEAVYAERVRELQAAGGPAGAGSLPAGPEYTSGRIVRWRARLLADGTAPAAVVGVALAAGLVEVASMLPYLIGMTMIADAPIGMPTRFGLLAGYCVVMILPALLLLAARVAAAGLVERPLQRLADWLERTGAENTAWILGIIGFLLLRAGATQLGIDLPIIGGG
ncbi:hypothetical protein D3248_10735 [Leucobacter zeae]|nr:hypothetical protein [Leucobacter zeae]